MYIITIKEKKVVDKMVGRDWAKGGPEQAGNDGYGYTPMITRPEEVEIELLRQTVEELDMVAVIKAVNKI